MVRINKSPAETALSRAVIRWGLARPVLIAESPGSSVYRVGLKSGASAATTSVPVAARWRWLAE